MKTDVQIQQDVMAELLWEPSVHATEIAVTVRDGVVTLGGRVASFQEKHDVERATQRVSGVKAIAVALDVQLDAFNQRDDSDIARAAENVLEWLNGGEKKDIHVMVESGWISLSGEVDWNFQRQEAADAVRHLMGVIGVSNQVAIRPTIALSSVKAEIEKALTRQARADANHVEVLVNGSDVTLSGRVMSWADRDAARDCAWRTPGVHSVVDNMTVA